MSKISLLILNCESQSMVLLYQEKIKQYEAKCVCSGGLVTISLSTYYCAEMISTCGKVQPARISPRTHPYHIIVIGYAHLQDQTPRVVPSDLRFVLDML
jgi:hypothetical protein